jgi:hypothetical protein
MLDKTEIYNQENKAKIPVLYNLNDTIQNNILDKDEYDNDQLSKTKEEAITLVGHKTLNNILEIYKQLEEAINN